MPVSFYPQAPDEKLATLRLPAPLAPITADEAKSLAALYALRGTGHVSPNPIVGAVLVDQAHRFLAVGAHEEVGSHHAEINAFAAFETLRQRLPEASLSGGTLYVTLEPCAHVGRTPACAPAVAKSGIKKVIYGAVDPNPAVNGRGAVILGQAGIETHHDLQWQPQCLEIAEIFHWSMEHKTPFVGLKVASTLDGVMARTGDRRSWITGERARAYGHFLRLRYDAIAIGGNTLALDDPTLDTRLASGRHRRPWRIVLDPFALALQKLPLKSLKMVTQEPHRILWFLSDHVSMDPVAQELLAHSLKVARLPVEASGWMSPASILEILKKQNIASLLLEGGSNLYGSFLDAALVNRIHIFQAGKIYGGSDALHWGHFLRKYEFTGVGKTAITALGEDWVVETRLDRP